MTGLAGLAVTLVKFLHIAALVIWCAGLFALPLMLGKHEAGEAQSDYARLRLLTHDSYAFIVTPAAVIAIAAGTALLYLRGVFVPWMFAKLVAVGLLVALHCWIGHIVILMSERRGTYTPPSPVPLLVGSSATMIAVLLLVLGKPVVPDLVPEWLTKPQNRQLPVDETPI
ncbi:CopD family protein [uncultured Sphingomonas sp.]|uniref:CopD family protein n=1 Tax=uncultured Sphingomonas sp. TaxID=158754 RepID=UPI002621A423|nr:CopD family protein [uncultured Sphingomonas sp.]